MPNHAFMIKTIAAEIASLREFRKSGGSLSDFLDSNFSPADSAEVTGAKILEYFCVDSSRDFNGFIPGVKLAVTFLDEILGKPEQRNQCLKDLKSVLASATDRQEILRWVKAWYG